MPAIQPARLKIQAAELAELAQSPKEFCRAFHEFLNFYSDRVHRTGLAVESPPLIRTFHIPQPVMRAVLAELEQFAKQNRDSTLALADELWLQPYFEFRLLAANLVGKVDPLPVKSITGRVNEWVTPSTEERLVNALIFSGLERLRAEELDEYFKQIDTWFKSKQVIMYSLGLKSIPPLVGESSFEDIPMIFRRLNQAMRSAPQPLKTETLVIIKILTEHYPQETAHFLRQVLLTAGENPNISWYVRHSLSYFPVDNQEYLRLALRSEDLSSAEG